MRVKQPKGAKGSLKWLQRAVERRPDLLQPDDIPQIEWRSPLKSDDYAEYRDRDFLNLVGCAQHADALSDFWPRGGPQWDALGVSETGPVLVEAKAHIPEFFSSRTAATEPSKHRIESSLRKVAIDLGATRPDLWSEIYFQYCNRLAFLWWLREQGVKATLFYVCFLNDPDLNGPTKPETWDAAFASANYALGLSKRHKLSGSIKYLYPDVTQLS
ncbi:hypothetical protein [Poseidonocella sedimentorum]|nr:hypothetical protein [Poseidonocella sedimentorum]